MLSSDDLRQERQLVIGEPWSVGRFDGLDTGSPYSEVLQGVDRGGREVDRVGRVAPAAGRELHHREVGFVGHWLPLGGPAR